LFKQAAIEWLVATDQVRLPSSIQNHDWRLIFLAYTSAWTP
jgi:hypothetical protein